MSNMRAIGHGAAELERETQAVTLVIPGRPVSKKNSQQMAYNRRTGTMFPVQSPAWRRYEKHAVDVLKKTARAHFAGPVHMQARYWLPDRRWWPDLFGLLQGTADLLEKAGVIDNDRNIVRVDGSEIVGLDKHNPRVEITIRALEAAAS